MGMVTTKRTVKEITDLIRAAEMDIVLLRRELREAQNAAAAYPPGTVCEARLRSKGEREWQTVRVIGMHDGGFGYRVQRQKKNGDWYQNDQWCSDRELRPIEGADN